MSSDDGVELNMKGLDQLLKALKGPLPFARVGILGGGARSNATTLNNATVGAAHEFGTTKLPMRSFLRMPIAEKMQKYMEEAGALDPAALIEVIRTGTFVGFIRKLGILGERIVMDGFDSGGFGKWQKSNMALKKNHQTLVETQQLRNSITSDVVEP